jgi:thioredoxin 1
VLVEFADENRRMEIDLLDDISQRYAGRARIAHLDTSVNYDAPCRYGVWQVPCVLLFQNGCVVDRLVGREPREVYCQCIDEALCPSWVI